MRQNWRKKAIGSVLAVCGMAVLGLSGCFFGERGEVEVSSGAETAAETSSEQPETTEAETVTETSLETAGQPALRDAMVMVGGTLYIWAYDAEFAETPQDYSLTGTVDAETDSRPQEDFEAMGIKEGAEIYTRSEGESNTIFVKQDGVWSAFIPYSDVASAYEYSREPWTFDQTGQQNGFRITFPDGSWRQLEGGDSGISTFTGNGGMVMVIQMSGEEAEEVYPYIDTEEACEELILNTGISSNFEITDFQAGLADSANDPEASYYHIQVRYTDQDAEYGYEERYALYCGGHFWQVQILMKDGEEEGRGIAAEILSSFSVPTCESQ